MKKLANKLREKPILLIIILLIAYVVVLNIGAQIASGIFHNIPNGTLSGSLIYIVQWIVNILLIIVVQKKILNDTYDFGMRRSGFTTGLILLLPCVVVIFGNIYELVTNFDAAKFTMDFAVIQTFEAFDPALNEEMLMRAILAGLLMMKLKEKKGGTVIAIIVSACVFGLAHLTNLTQPDAILSNVLLQVMYATAFGLVFGAAFLRSHNIWSGVLVHFIIDWTALLNAAPETASGAGEAVGDFVYSAILVIIALWIIRKEKQPEILKLWASPEAEE